MDPLASALQYLKGVGPRRAADLQHVGLSTIEDLLYRFPTRYEDRGHFQTIASLRPGVAASIAGEVLSCGVRPTRRPRFRIFEMLVRDQHRQPPRDLVQPAVSQRRLPPAPARDSVRQAGAHVARPADAESAIRDRAAGTLMTRPTAGPMPEERPSHDVHTGRIVPVYEKTGQLTAKVQRTLVHQALQQLPPSLPDPLPPEVRRATGADRSSTGAAGGPFPAA